MKTPRTWQGVRMRRTLAAADPDAPPRRVTLPASWDDAAAAGLAALAPGRAAVRLVDAAEAFIRPLAGRAAEAGIALPLAERLHLLLLTRRGAPDAPLWGNRRDGASGFVLNLAAFHDPAAGFLFGAFAEAVEAAALALALAARAMGTGGAERPALRIANLAGLIAALGLDYDSTPARDLGAEIAALLRARADAATRSLGRVLTALASPGPAEALLGAENGGIAPAFSPVLPDGSLTHAARASLIARGISTERALARTLAGASPFADASPTAFAAMRERMLPFFDTAAPMPDVARPAPAPRTREAPPSRARGTMQRANLAGHKLYVRTGEYDDGRLAEIAVSLARQGPQFRGLLDAFSAAVSVGLQHGVPLAEFAEAFLGAEVGPAGVVEGDPQVPRAASLLDYVFRNLAANYLPATDLPPPLPEHSPDSPGPEREAAGSRPPLLPLDLPAAASPRERRRSLRLVAK